VSAVRSVLAGLLVLVAVLLQTSVVARLALPLVRLDLVLVLVVAVALTAGPGLGAAVGFGAGLLTDLMADHPAGAVALVLCLVGYAGGRRVRPFRSGPVVVAAATVSSATGVAVVLAAVGRAPLDWPALGASLPASVAGNVILAVLIVPAAGAVHRILHPALHRR